MFGSVQKKNDKSQGENPVMTSVSSIKPKSKQLGRERLKHFDGEIRAARNAIEELEQQVARLKAISAESEAAARALQLAISNDGGVALAAYSSGQAKPTDEISKLVAHAETSRGGATAAAAALPHSEASLENARSQLVTLDAERHAELDHVVKMIADRDAKEYQRAFDAACIAHDKLVGYAAAFESNHGDVRLARVPIEMPRFALPSMGRPDADPYIRHLAPSELTVNASSRKYLAIRSRIAANPDADISDLL